MSIRLIRQSSETPNITNRDDARMVRYAYSGMNGVVKSFGSELSYNASGGKFAVGTGRIVLQGWEVDIEGSGWEISLSSVSSTQRYVIYLELSVGSETAEIKASYLTGSAFPTIDPGDDLTQYPDGTARLPLYQFAVSSGGSFSSIKKLVSTIPYTADKISDIEIRLEKLGFKKGSAVPMSSTSDVTITVQKNELKRQGNYVIGTLAYAISCGYLFDSQMPEKFETIGILPLQFLPLEDTYVNISFSGSQLMYYTPPGSSMMYDIVTPSDRVWVGKIESASGRIVLESPIATYYDTTFLPTSMLIQFGYEAKPLM